MTKSKKKDAPELPAHSKLGPSKADRWMHCHASVIEEPKYTDDKTSPFALEGSAAHRLAEICLRHKVNKKGRKPRWYVGKTCDETGLVYNAEMARAVDRYIEVCMGQFNRKKDKIFVENKLHTPSIHEQLFGTADCIIVKPGRVITIDFKYGRGIVVRAKKNTQMLLYTLMAVSELVRGDVPKKYRQIIVQPRVDDVGSRLTMWDFDLSRLSDFEKRVRDAVKAIDKLSKKYKPGDVIAREHYAPSESRCHFCRASGECEAQDTYNLDAMREAFSDTDTASFDAEFDAPDPDTMTAKRIAFVLAHKKAITTWLAAIEEHAIEKIMHSPGTIPDYKVVQGRSNRAWSTGYDDVKKLVKALKKIAPGVDADSVTVIKSMTVNQVQNVIGTMDEKQQKRFDKLWSKPPGKPTLVTVEDERTGLTTLDDFD